MTSLLARWLFAVTLLCIRIFFADNSWIQSVSVPSGYRATSGPRPNQPRCRLRIHRILYTIRNLTLTLTLTLTLSLSVNLTLTLNLTLTWLFNE